MILGACLLTHLKEIGAKRIRMRREGGRVPMISFENIHLLEVKRLLSPEFSLDSAAKMCNLELGSTLTPVTDRSRDTALPPLSQGALSLQSADLERVSLGTVPAARRAALGEHARREEVAIPGARGRGALDLREDEFPVGG